MFNENITLNTFYIWDSNACFSSIQV